MKQSEYILDDRHELFSFGSDCATCFFFNLNHFSCIAFPEGIPENILSGKSRHRQTVPNQEGNTVYTAK